MKNRGRKASFKGQISKKMEEKANQEKSGECESTHQDFSFSEDNCDILRFSFSGLGFPAKTSSSTLKMEERRIHSTFEEGSVANSWDHVQDPNQILKTRKRRRNSLSRLSKMSSQFFRSEKSIFVFLVIIFAIVCDFASAASTQMPPSTQNGVNHVAASISRQSPRERLRHRQQQQLLEDQQQSQQQRGVKVEAEVEEEETVESNYYEEFLWRDVKAIMGGVLGFWGGVGGLGTLFLVVVLSQRYCCRPGDDEKVSV